MTSVETVAEQKNITTVMLADAQVGPELSLQELADDINCDLEKSVEMIINIGRKLIKVRQTKPHGEWDRMFTDHKNTIARPLHITRQTAFRLMKIAEHPILSNVTHVQHLPSSWGTLYEFTKWPQDFLAECLRRGLITPDTTRTNVNEMLTHHTLAEPVQSLKIHFRNEKDLQGWAQLIKQPLTIDTKEVWYPSQVGEPFASTPPIKRAPRQDSPSAETIQSLKQDHAKLCHYVREVHQVLSEPLVIDDDRKIQSGVWWIPPFAHPINAKPIKTMHRCTCGDVHEDRRTTR